MNRLLSTGWQGAPHNHLPAYIALLAFTVVALLAMVAFGLISVAEAKEFNVIVATLVPLVSAAIVYYFRSKGGGDE